MSKKMNGVDMGALGDTITAIRNDPAIADFEFRLSNRWVDGGLNQSTIDGFFGAKQEMRHAQAFEPVNDEPAVLLSGDKGPNPVEYLLHALAGCLTTSLVYHAAARGIEDSPEKVRTYLKAVMGERYEEARVGAFIENAPRVLEFFLEKTSVRVFCPMTGSDYHPELPGGLDVGRALYSEPYDLRTLGALGASGAGGAGSRAPP